eukprot:scaffold268_cov134-Isochrysis_galbana.AAC.7
MEMEKPADATCGGATQALARARNRTCVEPSMALSRRTRYNVGPPGSVFVLTSVGTRLFGRVALVDPPRIADFFFTLDIQHWNVIQNSGRCRCGHLRLRVHPVPPSSITCAHTRTRRTGRAAPLPVLRVYMHNHCRWCGVCAPSCKLKHSLEVEWKTNLPTSGPSVSEHRSQYTPHYGWSMPPCAGGAPWC